MWDESEEPAKHRKDKYMNVAEKHDRGTLRIDEAECKGCGLCIEACPPKVIAMSDHLNHYGYRPAVYAGSGCTGCGICFFACPEPGAIAVCRLSNPVAASPAISREGAMPCPSN
jgi:NAD-dependent dihydropyrimidine dehydrogenase PreA subunit